MEFISLNYAAHILEKSEFEIIDLAIEGSIVLSIEIPNDRFPYLLSILKNDSFGFINYTKRAIQNNSSLITSSNITHLNLSIENCKKLQKSNSLDEKYFDNGFRVYKNDIKFVNNDHEFFFSGIDSYSNFTTVIKDNKLIKNPDSSGIYIYRECDIASFFKIIDPNFNSQKNICERIARYDEFTQINLLNDSINNISTDESITSSSYSPTFMAITETERRSLESEFLPGQRIRVANGINNIRSNEYTRQYGVLDDHDWDSKLEVVSQTNLKSLKITKNDILISSEYTDRLIHSKNQLTSPQTKEQANEIEVFNLDDCFALVKIREVLPGKSWCNDYLRGFLYTYRIFETHSITLRKLEQQLKNKEFVNSFFRYLSEAKIIRGDTKKLSGTEHIEFLKLATIDAKLKGVKSRKGISTKEAQNLQHELSSKSHIQNIGKLITPSFLKEVLNFSDLTDEDIGTLAKVDVELPKTTCFLFNTLIVISYLRCHKTYKRYFLKKKLEPILIECGFGTVESRFILRVTKPCSSQIDKD